MDSVIQLQFHALRSALERSLESPAHEGRQQSAPQLPWSPGERIAATVQATRSADRMLLRIGDFIFDAPRPPGVEAGQTLNLRYMTGGARPTFSLESVGEGAQAPSAEVEISRSARQLDNVVRAVSSAPARSPALIEEPTPLLPSPGTDAAQIASALQKSMDSSGLFYESHLRKWAEGDWPVERLMREPQARLANDRLTPAEPDVDNKRNGLEIPVPPSASADDRLSAASKENAGQSASFQQIRNQLELIDTRQLVWQGQLWPGQPLHLEVDDPPESDGSDEAPQWTSRLHISMPALGEVNAELVLSGASLRINLRPDTREAHDLLLHRAADLREALADAGLDLTGLRVADGKS